MISDDATSVIYRTNRCALWLLVSCLCVSAFCSTVSFPPATRQIGKDAVKRPLMVLPSGSCTVERTKDVLAATCLDRVGFGPASDGHGPACMHSSRSPRLSHHCIRPMMAAHALLIEAAQPDSLKGRSPVRRGLLTVRCSSSRQLLFAQAFHCELARLHQLVSLPERPSTANATRRQPSS